MGKAKDLTGMRYGMLTVIQQAQSRRKKCGYPIRRWKCLCDCGNYLITDACNLLSGDTKSCGCYKIKRTSQRSRKDITGMKFGRLTALNLDHVEKQKAYWNCICDCGNNAVVPASYLCSGNTKSCGCMQRVGDISGQKFHMLTVLYQQQPYIDSKGRKNRMWMCRCDCGRTKIISHHHIKETVSCGCIRSVGQLQVRKYLQKNNIVFQEQKKFSDCVSIHELRFDFYIPQYNCCIQFDGRQHYDPYKDFYTQQFVRQIKQRDQIKNNYCVSHGICLIRIKYVNIKKINDILNEWFLNIKNDSCPALFFAG